MNSEIFSIFTKKIKARQLNYSDDDIDEEEEEEEEDHVNLPITEIFTDD